MMPSLYQEDGNVLVTRAWESMKWICMFTKITLIFHKFTYSLPHNVLPLAPIPLSCQLFVNLFIYLFI